MPQLLPFAAALRRTLDAAVPIDRVETALIGQADGRALAADVRATADVPPFDRAAMDGYAVRAEDTTGASADTPVTLTRVGEGFTGAMPEGAIRSRECLAIATGAPMPAGADAVVMIERTRRDRDLVSILEPASAGQHVGRQGSDMRGGQVVLMSGEVIDPARAGAAAATGVTAVPVHARPTVALVSTGDELVEPGRPLTPGRIYDINRITLTAIVRRHGGDPVPLPPAGDTVDALSRALDAALAHDVVVFSGRSSVGERDLLREVVGARGEILYHGIAVKPGKPTMLARIGGTPVFGMPGNPTSCLSNGYLLLAPFLRRTARLPPWVPRTATLPLAAPIRSASDRHQFYTVRVTDKGVEPAFKGSGDITSMAHAHGYIEIAVGTGVLEQGAAVTVTFF